jgi:hypothetical protein
MAKARKAIPRPLTTTGGRDSASRASETRRPPRSVFIWSLSLEYPSTYSILWPAGVLSLADCSHLARVRRSIRLPHGLLASSWRFRGMISDLGRVGREIGSWKARNGLVVFHPEALDHSGAHCIHPSAFEHSRGSFKMTGQSSTLVATDTWRHMGFCECMPPP